MKKRENSGSRGAWRDRGELSFEEVSRRLNVFWTDFETAYKETGPARRFLLQQRLPDPAHYQRGMSIIKTLRGPVQRFCTFLGRSQQLPSAVLLARYPLIQALHSIDASLCTLDPLVTLLLVQASPTEGIERLRAIQQNIQAIQQTWPRARRGRERVHCLISEKTGEGLGNRRSPKKELRVIKGRQTVASDFEAAHFLVAGQVQMLAFLLLEKGEVPTLKRIASICKLSTQDLGVALEILAQRNLVEIADGNVISRVVLI